MRRALDAPSQRFLVWIDFGPDASFGQAAVSFTSNCGEASCALVAHLADYLTIISSPLMKAARPT
jgi:hypothetical protein